jgi:spore maturation protein CgeB
MPPAVFAVAEMARGYRDALRRAGHDVAEYVMLDALAYHRRASAHEHERLAWRRASEPILQAAIYHQSDLVLFVCPLSFHPIALELLVWGGFKIVALHTDSPYQDDEQVAWNRHAPDMHVFTHERTSAQRYGWSYLPHAYDSSVHVPVEPDPSEACDVLFVGNGFKERIALLEAIDWTGIDLRLRGVWTDLSDDSPLRTFCRGGVVNNADLPRLYASAKICINPHRYHPDAVSLNPSAYELAACGVFQITDDRNDGSLFSRMLVRYGSSDDLQRKIRHYLAHQDERAAIVDALSQLVGCETFDARAKTLMDTVCEGFTS